MNIWNFILEKLSDNKSVMLLTIIESQGSSPGRQGFKMAVCDDNELNGSVGGGVLEYEMVELSKKLLKEKEVKPLIKHQIHKDDVKENRSGLICSGEQYITFFPFGKEHLNIVEQIVDSLKSDLKLVLSLSDSEFKVDIDNTFSKKFYSNITDDKKWIYQEQIVFDNTIYIVGAGHVGLALSETMKQLDYKVVIIDNRNNLNTFENNKFADVKKIIDYNNICDHVLPGENSYVVIMTFSHAFDKFILGKLANNNFAYLGLMGSKKKVNTLYAKLNEEGISQEKLNKVYAPIGVPISSKTPAEIAISIAAEIVKVKNNK